MNKNKLWGMPLKDRLELRTKKTKTCWIWMGPKNNKGYGYLSDGIGKKIYSHRASYTIYIGKIPSDMCVLHRCDTPLCINPSHLRLGTHKENMQEASLKKRTRGHKTTHCPYGHAYSKTNTFINKQKSRVCLKCKRMNSRMWMRKTRAALKAQRDRL